MIKNAALLLATALLLCGCRDTRCLLTGTLDPADTAIDSLRLLALPDDTPLASVAPEAGRFHLTIRADKPIATRLTDGTRTLTLLFPEAGEITVSPDGRGGYRTAGTPLNDLWARLCDRLDSLHAAFRAAPTETQEEVREAHIRLLDETVAANRDNALGAYVCSFCLRPLLEPAAWEQRATMLEPIGRQRPTQHPETGASARHGVPTPLTLPDTAGQNRPLVGKIAPDHSTLLLFWATWDATARKEFIRLERRLTGNPHLTLQSVSLDNDSTAWHRFVRRHGRGGTHLLGTQKGKSPAAETYGIRTLPTVLLLDPDGRIEARSEGAGASDRLLAAPPATRPHNYVPHP